MRTNETTYLRGLSDIVRGRNLSYDARAMNIDRSTMERLVRCSRGASLAMALTIARYYGKTVEDVVGSVQAQRKQTPGKILTM